LTIKQFEAWEEAVGISLNAGLPPGD